MKIKLFLAASLFFSCALFATTRYVSPSGNGTPPYTSWSSAATSILNAVSICADGDVVLVSNGVYTIGSAVTPGATTMNRVLITNDIILRSVEGPEKTVIDGLGSTRCVFMSKGTLDGFKLTNGYAITGIGFYNGAGGGLWITNGCAVTNCIVINCNAYFIGGGLFYYGGDVYDTVFCNNICSGSTYYGTSGGAVAGGGTLLNCIISNNYCMSVAGGIFNYGGPISVKNCKIVNNSAVNMGGGTYGGNIYNSLLAGNFASDGGGAYNTFLSNCVITANCATNNGGGMYWGTARDCKIIGNVTTNDGGGGYEVWLIEKCLVGNNSAMRGGGIFGQGCVSSSIISNNTAKSCGGGVCFIKNYSSGLFAMTNCLIVASNTAEYGGGLALLGNGNIFSCTIADNLAKKTGGGVYCTTALYNDQINFYDTIIYNNLALENENNWFTNGTISANFSACCTYPTNGLPQYEVNCIPDNPLFVSSDYDYHLQVESPCIDAGIDRPWMTGATDLDGNPRVQGGGVDIGCYELVPEPIFFATFAFALLIIKKLRHRA